MHTKVAGLLLQNSLTVASASHLLFKKWNTVNLSDTIHLSWPNNHGKNTTGILDSFNDNSKYKDLLHLKIILYLKPFK